MPVAISAVEGAMTPEMKPYPVVEAVIDIFANWLKHRREMAETCGCDAQEYSRVAHELGVSADELDYLVRHGSHAADELPKMMATLGLHATAIQRAYPAVMRDMERVCAHCEHKYRCREDVVTGDAPQTFVEYCDNASTLESLGAKS